MDEQTTSRKERTGSRATAPVRRNVLRGIGAVGLGTAFAGLGRAQPDHVNDGNGTEENPIGSQLFTYISGGFSVSELIHHHADAGYDIVEPFFIDDEDAILEALGETGIEMPTIHARGFEDDLKAAIDTYSQFGIEALVIPSGGDWSSEESIVEWAETVNELADEVVELSEGEMTVGFHNHAGEFEAVDGTGYDIFAEHVNENVHLQVDVAWAWVGGADPVEVVNRYRDNVRSLHMKDAVTTEDGAELVEIGDGDVPLEAVANVARTAADVDYLLYEYDRAPEPLESLYHGAEWLETWNGAEHRRWNSG